MGPPLTLPLLQDLEDRAEALGLRMVVLFGSRARGLARPGSDLDVAVLDKEAPSADRWREVYFALAEVFRGYALDLVFLNTADPLFRFEIMRHGLLLYGDRTLFDSYRIFAYRDFVASEDLRRLEGILFRKKMAFLHRCLHDQ